MAVVKMMISFILLISSFHLNEGATNEDGYNSSRISGDEYFTSGSGSEGDSQPPCCSTRDFQIHSISDILNYTSSKIVNITSDDVLSSKVTLKGLENVTIIGHRNPVINCSHISAVQFISCKNMIIRGIRWENCGSMIYPGITLYNSTNVSIESCSFYNSKGKTVSLSEMFGYVYISNCHFMHNIEYNGHGAAIHYLPSANISNDHRLLIRESKFILNKPTKSTSVVYIDCSGSRAPGHVLLQDNIFTNNSGVPLYISHTNLYIRGDMLFNENGAESGGGIFSNNSNITFYGQSNVSFESNSAAVHGGVIYLVNSGVSFEIDSNVIFKRNKAKSNGGVIYATKSNITFNGNSNVTFINNKSGFSGGVVYCHTSSRITFDGNSSVVFSGNKVRYHGGAIFCQYSSPITFSSSSKVTFNSNQATVYSGGAIYCQISSQITFQGKSIVNFNNNIALRVSGGALFCQTSSHINFIGNSHVIFSSNNAADHGGAFLCQFSSNVSFSDNSRVTISNNKAGENGGALVIQRSSNLTFNNNTSVTISKNIATKHGGAILCQFFSHITFNGNSLVTFNGNEGIQYNGGAVFCQALSNITFDGNSSVTFYNNRAGRHGGVIFCQFSSHITIGSYSVVTLLNNRAHDDGGAIYTLSHIKFEDNSSVTFTNNSAASGGALLSHDKSCVSFQGKSVVQFTSNKAIQGGAMYSKSLSRIIFDNNSAISFYNNTAALNGGAILSSNVVFTAYSTVVLHNNVARQDGSAIYSVSNAQVLFDKNCLVLIQSNIALQQGGAVYLFDKASIIFKGHSNVTFLNNTAKQHGGAIYSERQVFVVIEENSTVTLKGNKAGQNGGAFLITDHSTATFTAHSKVRFSNSKVTRYGGAIYCGDNSNITIGGNVLVQFSNNTSEYGGALSVLQSIMEFEGNSSVDFTMNSAEKGGAIYCDLTKTTKTKISFNTTDVVFHKNTDLQSSDVFLDIPTSCNKTCLNSSIVGIKKGSTLFGGIIKTSPRKLSFNDTAKCIDIDNDTVCQKYLISNIMLGQEIVMNACVLDHYDQASRVTQFVLGSIDKHYDIIGSPNMLLSCETFKGVGIKGERIMKPANYSMNITSYERSHFDSKKFSVELITELSPCHPGYYYDNATQTCACYSDYDIVSCSGSESSIKRGYWFGEVDETVTVAICPSSYCNFTCCETSNGIYKLSPVRANQCNSQRSGTACGNCMEGYTLSFDSVECVSVNKCTIGQTVLVVTLSIIYWVVIVILVFLVTYYHVGIGYLYSITYYYSVVDILLRERLYTSQGLFTLVSIMSSIAKVKPQFLGQLCLVTNMSGIDQQFIHYVHPLAVAVIIAVICLSARLSYKFSAFVSRGIIHVICFLLLLSYTSVATTSLLLLRSLKFYSVDKIYTYLSPDIEYLHGRHLPYCILAVLCSLLIVIGLPLLLLTEPLVNNKISFAKIKPLLDQFKGCYKDKYRSFAAYYMICRLVIILIIIANPSNDNTSQYLLIIFNSLLALIHMTLRPYESNTLNMFDGFVLQLMIAVSMTPLIGNCNSDLMLAYTFILVLLPFLVFLMMEIFLYKKAIKKITKHCLPLDPNNCTDDNKGVPMRSFVDSVIDDSRRVNATICEIEEADVNNDVTCYRESFMEIMDEIED